VPEPRGQFQVLLVFLGAVAAAGEGEDHGAARQLEIEAGVPVAAQADGDGAVFSAVLPAGRYVTLVHAGHPAGLCDATAGLLAWASEQGLAFDMAERDGAGHWACRLEIYLTDPSQEPDMDKWQTRLAFKLA